MISVARRRLHASNRSAHWDDFRFSRKSRALVYIIHLLRNYGLGRTVWFVTAVSTASRGIVRGSRVIFWESSVILGDWVGARELAGRDEDVELGDASVGREDGAD